VLIGLLRPRALMNWACLATAVLVICSLKFQVQIGVRLVLPLVALGVVGLSAALVTAVRTYGPGWRRGLLLASGVTLPASLRILADMMAASGDVAIWRQLVDKVRQGGKLSDALAQTGALPSMAVRTLRLGEDAGQLSMLAGRVADFYDAKLQRSLDRVVGVIGPASIIVISLIVGGLIVSVMTALLSINQIAE